MISNARRKKRARRFRMRERYESRAYEGLTQMLTGCSTASSRRARLLAAPPPVGHPVVVFGHDLHAFLTAPSCAAAPRLLERHQKSERRILELQVPQHVPVLAHV